MPLTKYTGANLKKMKKFDLISHILDLYQFTDLFNNEALYKKQIAKLEEENEKLKRQLEEKTDEYNIITFYNTEHKKQVVKLEEENEELKDKVVELEGEKLELQLNKDKCLEYIDEYKEENTILTNYRNCMDKIQKEFNDIEDIVDVLPFMKSMKEKNNKMKDMLLKFKKECHKVKDK